MNEQYDVFISYRRDGGESTAKMLHDKLENLGYCVFFDVESLRSGNFNTALYSVIDECKDFLLVLSPGALDRCENADDWVRLEIERALEKDLNIIPVMLRGFSFPKELPPSIDQVRYKNGIEASYNFFDAFVDKLQKFLVSEHSKDRRRKPKFLLISAALIAILGICLIAGFSVNRQDSKYPSTDYEKNLSGDLIYYIEMNLQQMEQAVEYMDTSYQACNEYIEHYDTTSYSALLAKLSQNMRLLKKIDTDSALMSDDLRNKLMESPFDLAGLSALHDYVVIFVEGSVDTLDYVAEKASNTALVDLNTMKNVISNYQEVLDEECKIISYNTNAMLLTIENEETLKQFKYDFLPTLYYIQLQASNWSSDIKSLESDMERSWNAIDKAMEKNIAMLGDSNLELMMLKTENIQQLMSDGYDYETAKLMVEEWNGKQQLVGEKEAIREEFDQDLEEFRQGLEDELEDKLREKNALSPDDDGNTILNKMHSFLNAGFYDDALEYVAFYREKMRDDESFVYVDYVEEYCDAMERFIKNINRTGIGHGIMIVGYDPDDPHEQYKIGDVIIAVDGIPCYNYDEYDRFQEEREEGQDFTVVVLREDEKNSGRLKQIKLEIPGDAPKVAKMNMTKKEFGISADYDTDELLEMMSQFFGESGNASHDKAIACINLYRERMRGQNEYVEEYCAAMARFIRNYPKTDHRYGMMVIGYGDDDQQNQQLKIGDVIIAVNGVNIYNYEDCLRFQENKENGESFLVVVLREDEENPGQLQQIKLEIPGDAPSVQLRKMSDKKE